MKLEINYKDNEYEILVEGKKVFNWKNHRRILREVRNILDRHEELIVVKRLR